MKQTMFSLLLASMALSNSAQTADTRAASLSQDADPRAASPMQTEDSLSASTDSIYKSFTLDEVKVTIPSKTKMKGDALLTRIVGSAIENAGTAEEALAKVPGMMVRNGKLEVVGKGSPIYYINGRKVNDLTELQRLSSHDIKDVEVINTPGARYDAQVSAVVRIRTLHRRGEGWGFSLDSRDAKGLSCSNNQWNTTLNLNYHHNKFDLFGGVTYNNDYLGRYATEVTQHSYTQNSLNAPAMLDEMTTGGNGVTDFGQTGSTNMNWRYNSFNFNLGMDWQLAENHSVGLKVERSANLKGVVDFNMQDAIIKGEFAKGELASHAFAKNEKLMDELISDTHTDTDHSDSWLANAYYMGKFGRWGIDWNVDYYHSSEAAMASTVEQSMVEDRNVQSHNAVKNSLVATKLILSYPLWNGNLSIGTEMAFVSRKSNYDITEEGIRNSRNSVKENTYAAFVEYSKMIACLGQLSIGTRYEHVDFSYDDPLAEATGLSTREGQPATSLNRHLNDVYPYIGLGTQIGTLQGSLSYSVKTRRPNYHCLRSNIEYNNRYTLSTGNPTLSNEVRHEVGANARWKWLGCSLNYAYIKEGIYDWTYPHDDAGTVLVSWVNLDKPLQQLSLFVNASPSLGIWQPSYTVGMQKQWLSFELDDPRTATGKRHVSNNKPIFFCNTNNAFHLPTRDEDGRGAWLLELNSELMSNGHWGNAEITNWSWNLSCALQKAFLHEDALTVRLAVSDIFHKTYNNVRIDLGNYVMTQTHILGVERECYDFQRITLSVRYKLNANKRKYKGKGAGAEMLYRM